MKIFYYILLIISALIISCSPQVIIEEEIVYETITGQSEIIDPDQVKKPLISPLGGVFFNEQEIELTCETEGAIIRYTIDGTNPSRTEGVIYSTRLRVNIFKILKVIAYKDPLKDSNIVRSAYSFKVGGINYTADGNDINSDLICYSDLSLDISNATDGSVIYYTTDGSMPSSTSNMYTTPLTLSNDITIRSIAYKYGWSYSETKTTRFTFVTEPPLFYPVSGNYDSTIDLVLSPAISGADIYYTLNGDVPDTSSDKYTGAFSINKTTRVKAIACKSGMQNSVVAEATYTFKTITPIITPSTGVYNSNQMVSITSSPDALIYYTINDTTPDINSTIYTAPIPAVNGTIIRAVGYKTGFETSSINKASYAINSNLTQLSTPVADKATGSYLNEVTIDLTSDAGSFIKYTLDGTTPSLDNGLMYENPILINKTTQLKAISYMEGSAFSELLSNNYVITGTVLNPEIISLEDNQICSGAVKLEIDNPTSEAITRYTINGAEPTETDFVYNGPVSLVSGTSTLIIQVKSFKPGWTPSGTITRTITFKLPDPNFNPQDVKFNKVANVIISQAVLGAEIKYTVDGTEPSSSHGLVYNGEILILDKTTTIKAFSSKSGWENSNISTVTYTLTQ